MILIPNIVLTGPVNSFKNLTMRGIVASFNFLPGPQRCCGGTAGGGRANPCSRGGGRGGRKDQRPGGPRRPPRGPPGPLHHPHSLVTPPPQPTPTPHDATT